MRNQITLRKGFVVAVIALLALPACKKEDRKPEVMEQTLSEQELNYKHSSTVKIYGETAKDGYLQLTVSSDDKEYLEEYTNALEQSMIKFELTDPSQEEKNKPEPLLTGESESKVFLSFDWSNYHFNFEKGKLYGIFFVSKNLENNKALVKLHTSNNVSGFTTTSGYAAVNVYSTLPSFNGGCLCTVKGRWRFTNSDGYFFYEKNLTYHDNLELRCFTSVSLWTSNPNNLPEHENISVSTILNVGKVYYRPRLNYTSPDLPGDYVDYNFIRSGNGSDTYVGMPAEATVTYYIKG